MQLRLELLVPAKNKDIGISAIDCGADAVYIAGPAFGAREAASNSFEEIEKLASYAHRFGVRIYMTLNTILYDNELSLAEQYIHQAYIAGCDAIIIQDLGILKMSLPPIELYASTQCNIRTPEQAKWLESLGFKRLILARELSLEQIKAIRAVTSCELETFIHGALCVCYSGQCYLSQYLSGRSANRGSCIQACRSDYDLEDASGNVLLRNKPLLSLKDLSLSDRISELAEAGITSFKIEGRLKNASYIKNVTRYYRNIIDSLQKREKSSLGHLQGGFTPNIEYTFNRGYTSLFIDGKRQKWNSGEAAKSMGEKAGTVGKILNKGGRTCTWTLSPASSEKERAYAQLSNGDGLFLITPDGKTSGIRVDVARGAMITTKNDSAIIPGSIVYRNFNHQFEKELESNMPKRIIDVETSIEATLQKITFSATAEGGATALFEIVADETHCIEDAKNRELAFENIRKQFEKNSGDYLFHLESFNRSTDAEGFVPFLPLSVLNSIRRDLSEKLSAAITSKYIGRTMADASPLAVKAEIVPPAQTIRLNCSNHLSASIYEGIGIHPSTAFELSTDDSAPEYRELMRTKYCIKYELGLCGKKTGPLFLVNNKKKIRVDFDCKRCEMVLFLVTSQNEI